MANAPLPAAQGTTSQLYGRACTLLVSDVSNNALDLSQLRIKFSVKRTATQTPNTAWIRVYNLALETAALIQTQLTQVILQAGYTGTVGDIFRGNIVQVIVGRESATDTFVDLICGDGAQAYNYAVVTVPLAKNWSQSDLVGSCVQSMSKLGVKAGNLSAVQASTRKYPRGRAVFRNARDVLRQVGKTIKSDWSIQNETVQFVPSNTYAPGTAVVINPQTGMVGTPQQTNDGVNVKCLLNPFIPINGQVKLNNATIALQQLNLEQLAAFKGNQSAINNAIPRRLNSNGLYKVITIEQSGDTRGIEWYSSLLCLSVDASANPMNSVATT